MISKNEFALIKQFFTDKKKHPGTIIGSGDDAAVLQVPAGHQLVVSVDTLVSGVHFFPSVDPYDLGYKVLAVNLSDLAAMGAQPAWATLALTLPAVDETWLNAFSKGFFALADEVGVELVGGDLTRGSLTVTCQIHGYLPNGSALQRNGARPGDWIGVTGYLGDAGFALDILQHTRRVDSATLAQVLPKLLRPVPRIAQGLCLRGLAHAAIDISDGLWADLSHILDASGVGACVSLDAIPLSPALTQVQPKVAQTWALSAGDDYELCFTLPAARWTQLPAQYDWYPIGVIEPGSGLRCQDQQGRAVHLDHHGYRHFA